MEACSKNKTLGDLVAEICLSAVVGEKIKRQKDATGSGDFAQAEILRREIENIRKEIEELAAFRKEKE